MSIGEPVLPWALWPGRPRRSKTLGHGAPFAIRYRAMPDGKSAASAAAPPGDWRHRGAGTLLRGRTRRAFPDTTVWWKRRMSTAWCARCG